MTKIESLMTAAMALVSTVVQAAEPSVIPRPASMELKAGSFEITATCEIVASEALQLRAEQLNAMLAPASGLKLKVSATPTGAPAIMLKLDASLSDLGEDGYKLDVSPEGIVIQALSSGGVFYGIQTLRQLLPSAIVSPKPVANVPWIVPAVAIVDSPRFSWRAFMLDEGRYFQGMRAVKSLLDQMSYLKMNVFHWHLVDDQGWRIEIKKYPKLTEIGSKRVNSQTGNFSSRTRSGQPHEGFYTQEEIKEIVKYAADRNITIVPEIEMPGHASAAIAAYPWLGTKREQISVPFMFGKHYPAFNPADEKVYDALSEILDEVLALFPSKIIHIGGDEVRFNHWQQSAEVKELMKREGLKTVADVQIYFTNRMSQIIEKKGRRMMGWNEIMGDDLHGFLKGGQTRSAATLSKNAVVHFWKGNAALATRAIEAGHDVVNSWHSYTYLDYGYSGIPMEKAYEFNPVFKGLDPKYHHKVIGMGCQMWGEWIPTEERMELMVYPRIAAYAEVGWTPLARKEYREFTTRMQTQLKRWSLEGIGYTKALVVEYSAKDFFNYTKIDTWTPAVVDEKWSVQSFSTGDSIKTAGNYEVAFVYEKGEHGIDIEGVELCRDGEVIAKDSHSAFSGIKMKRVMYELSVKSFDPKATYTLQAKIKGSKGTDSFGEIKIQSAE